MEQIATQVVFKAGHVFTDCLTALQTEQIWMKQICDCPIPRWHHRRSCELPRRSCRTWARPSAGTRKSCRQVLQLRCDLRGGREKSPERQNGHLPKEESSDSDVKNLNLINCFSIFAAASRAVPNIWHQKWPPPAPGRFFFSTPPYTGGTFPLSPPVLFTLPLMCSHFAVPSHSVGNVYTAFMAVLICRTPHRGRRVMAGSNSDHTKKISSHLRRESGALFILFFLNCTFGNFISLQSIFFTI